MGGVSVVCSAVSYFSTRVGSIIGAGRLSFRVRDGSGRFPAAMSAVTLFFCVPLGCGGWVAHRVVRAGPVRPCFTVGWVFMVGGCGCLCLWVWLRQVVVFTTCVRNGVLFWLL